MIFTFKYTQLSFNQHYKTSLSTHILRFHRVDFLHYISINLHYLKRSKFPFSFNLRFKKGYMYVYIHTWTFIKCLSNVQTKISTTCYTWYLYKCSARSKFKAQNNKIVSTLMNMKNISIIGRTLIFAPQCMISKDKTFFTTYS